MTLQGGNDMRYSWRSKVKGLPSRIIGVFTAHSAREGIAPVVSAKR